MRWGDAGCCVVCVWESDFSVRRKVFDATLVFSLLLMLQKMLVYREMHLQKSNQKFNTPSLSNVHCKTQLSLLLFFQYLWVVALDLSLLKMQQRISCPIKQHLIPHHPQTNGWYKACFLLLLLPSSRRVLAVRKSCFQPHNWTGVPTAVFLGSTTPLPPSLPILKRDPSIYRYTQCSTYLGGWNHPRKAVCVVILYMKMRGWQKKLREEEGWSCQKFAFFPLMFWQKKWERGRRVTYPFLEY